MTDFMISGQATDDAMDIESAVRGVEASRGRPGLINNANVRARYLLALNAGARHEEAAIAAGVGRSTFYAWMRRGRRASILRENGDLVPPTEQAYLDFLDESCEAEARLEVRLVGCILAAAEAGSWRAAAFALERRFGPRWSGGDSGAQVGEHLETKHEEVSLEDLERKVQAVLALRGEL